MNFSQDATAEPRLNCSNQRLELVYHFVLLLDLIPSKFKEPSLFNAQVRKKSWVHAFLESIRPKVVVKD